MKVRLRSDFLDYYDHHFDREGTLFHRMSRDGLSKSHVFNTMKSWGLRVPIFGICKDMTHHFSKDYSVVVYEDEYAHCGEGKKILKYHQALEQFPEKLISEYLSGEIRSFSLRYLSIGAEAYILSYKSDDFWRSNVGNVQISVLQKLDPSESNFSNNPLFAIDFVKDYGLFYAIDFNSAPGLKGTGIEDILKPKDVVGLIKSKIEKVC